MTQWTKDIADRTVALFSSLRLAISLLILLAMVSVLGTLIPQEQDPSVYIQQFGPEKYTYLKYLGLIDLYHSWGFRALMILITVNLVVCTLRRFKGVYRRTVSPAAEKSPEEIASLKIHNELPEPSKHTVIERALADKGYSLLKRGRFIYGTRGVFGIWGDMITHLSIFMVIMGALIGSAGFVSTVNVYVGGFTDVAYNWSTGEDEPLGFRLNVENFNLKYYPLNLHITIRRLSTGEKVGEYQTREGGLVAIQGTGLTISPVSVDMLRREVMLKIYDHNKLSGIYDTGQSAGGPAAPIGLDYLFFLDSYDEPMPMSIVSTVSLSKGGRMLKRGVVEVNSPMRFEGMTIYQTAFGRDNQGKEYTGFQIANDPGLPLVMAGFALLLVGLFVSFFFSHRQVWVFVGDDRLYIGGTTSKDWGGFMTEYGGLIKSFMQEVEP